ncbi:MAG: sulfite exporter TauE/SafE family protein [Polyangiaceae bacterium]|nr:sulfite exporter TauE/SafE family protein [Polyangiaceae bacterium]
MEWFDVYLPIAGLQFNVLVLLLIGFTVGVCGGFFGIGGAWIVTPALNIFGFPMPYAIGTDLAHMGGKSIVSTIRHGRFGNVDYKLGVTMILGTTLGMEMGARLVMWLERIGVAGPVIRKAYIVFLAFIGAFVLYDYIKHSCAQRGRGARSGGRAAGGVDIASTLHRIKIPPMIHFRTAGITCSMWLPVIVGLLSGIVAAVLGVGGGFIRMPALVYLIGCPTAVAVGTDLFEVMITGSYGAFTFGVKGRVEIIAAMWMLASAAVGAQIGTVAVKYVRGYSIRLLFAVTIYLACASVVLKQLKMDGYAAIVIMVAAVAICGVIIAWLVRGMLREIASKRTPRPVATGSTQ